MVLKDRGGLSILYTQEGQEGWLRAHCLCLDRDGNSLLWSRKCGDRKMGKSSVYFNSGKIRLADRPAWMMVENSRN